MGDDPDYDVVRHQAAARHDVLGLEADRRLRRHGGAQHLTGRELGNAVTLNQPLRLRPLARPRRPEKNQSHAYSPPGSVSDRPRTSSSKFTDSARQNQRGSADGESYGSPDVSGDAPSTSIS